LRLILSHCHCLNPAQPLLISASSQPLSQPRAWTVHVTAFTKCNCLFEGSTSWWGGDAASRRGEEIDCNITSRTKKFKYIPGQFGVDFLWISVDFGENGVDFGENGQVLTPTDETFQCVRVLLSILVKTGSIFGRSQPRALLEPSPASAYLCFFTATFTATSLDGACNCIYKM
jgi:hypothetical protein